MEQKVIRPLKPVEIIPSTFPYHFIQTWPTKIHWTHIFNYAVLGGEDVSNFHYILLFNFIPDFLFYLLFCLPLGLDGETYLMIPFFKYLPNLSIVNHVKFWKTEANVVLLIKKGSKDKLGNYEPVTSMVDKLFEEIIRDRFY